MMIQNQPDQPIQYTQEGFEEAFIDPQLISKGGAFSDVYTYLHQQTDTKMAVKKLKDGIEDPGHHNHFLLWVYNNLQKGKNENQIQQRLFPHQHDNITRFIGQTIDSTKLIMEFHPYGSLYEVTNLVPFSENIAKRLMIQLARVFYYLHIDNNIIHGDIKPPIIHGDIKLQNILISTQYIMKLCDFGFAQENQEQNQELNQTLGYSVGYSAPEIFTPPVEDKAKVDTFALGVVFFQILTGFAPFNRNNPNELITDQYWNLLHLQQYQNFWDLIQQKSGLLISNNFKTLIEGMLHPESQQRWSIGEVIICDYLQENEGVASETEVINELYRRVLLINQ